MITQKELNRNNYTLDRQQQLRFYSLHIRLNDLRRRYGRPMIVTSGFRSLDDQKRVNPKNMNSAHTKAAAADIADTDGRLWDFLMDNLELCEKIGLWMESKTFTPRWVHLQVYPPKSGVRIYLP